MARNLSSFTVKQLASATDTKLTRGRPSAALRLSLEDAVQAALAAGSLKIKKGELVRA